MTDTARLAEFEATGRLWLRAALPEEDLERLDPLARPGRPGTRLDAGAAVDVLGPSGRLGRTLSALWPGMRPVRLVAFSKDSEANWGVPWHQDRVIAVRDRAEGPGFAAWSSKGGAWHCEPPLALLEGMLFVRVHLDPATPSNGPMEIALGSHRQGVVAAAEAEALAGTCACEACLGERGDVLVLKMLTLHRSRPSRDGQPRRALRVDYAAGDLPAPLAWADGTRPPARRVSG